MGNFLNPLQFCFGTKYEAEAGVKSLKSEFNVWYLNDGVLANDPSIVFQDLQQIIQLSSKIDLSLITRNLKF
jgi:hypothetical protein